MGWRPAPDVEQQGGEACLSSLPRDVVYHTPPNRVKLCRNS